MILQAVVFASGHAGYANQPAYARVVELIIPSFVFGALFLAFGLLPGIVLHFAYDSTWMALPLFVASGTRAHIEQAVVVLAVLVPLWAVLLKRARAGQWNEVPRDAFNASWAPPVTGPVTTEPVAESVRTVISPSVRRALPIAGLIGLVVWIFAAPFRTDAPPIQIPRSEAIQKAREALIQRGIQLQSSWTVLSQVEGQPGEMNRFVWQTAGREHYKSLLSVYVTPPSWFIRFARFEGDVAERAEEYQVSVDGSGRVLRVRHELPEATPGKNLTQEEARAIAVKELGDPSSFKEVSADAQKRPARTDWTFVFTDTRNYGLTEGEPRVSIAVAGDQVVDSIRYVFVPDEWSRKERAKQTIPGILGTICIVILVAIVASTAIIGVIHWSRHRQFSPRTFVAVFATLFATSTMGTFNNWPGVASLASTAQPLALQVGIALAAGLVFGLFSAIALGLVAGLVGSKLGTSSNMFLGVSIGLLWAGAGALARHAVPSPNPLWGNLGVASAVVPLIGGMLAPLGGYFTQTLVVLAFVYALTRWPRATWIWILAGLALVGTSGIDTTLGWLILGVTAGIVLLIAYLLVFRQEPALVVLTTATVSALAALRDGFQHPYPAALTGAFIAALLIGIAAWTWYRKVSLG
jgi:hypothetical protein